MVGKGYLHDMGTLNEGRVILRAWTAGFTRYVGRGDGSLKVVFCSALGTILKD